MRAAFAARLRLPRLRALAVALRIAGDLVLARLAARLWLALLAARPLADLAVELLGQGIQLAAGTAQGFGLVSQHALGRLLHAFAQLA